MRIVPPLLYGHLTNPPVEGVIRNRPSGLNAADPQPRSDTFARSTIFPLPTSINHTLPVPYTPTATSLPSGLNAGSDTSPPSMLTDAILERRPTSHIWSPPASVPAASNLPSRLNDKLFTYRPNPRSSAIR